MSKINYYVDVNSTFRDVNKYPNPMDYAVSFKKFDGTGTFLNGVPFSAGDYYESCSIDPDYSNSFIQVKNGIIDQLYQSGNIALVAGRTKTLNVAENTIFTYFDQTILEIVNSSDTSESQSFLVCFTYSSGATVPYTFVWCVVAAFGFSETKFKLTTTNNECYFLFDYINTANIYLQSQLQGSASVSGNTVAVLNSPPTYVITSPLGNNIVNLGILKIDVTNAQFANVNGQDWGYHRLFTKYDMKATSGKLVSNTNMVVDNANNLIVSCNATLNPQVLNTLSSSEGLAYNSTDFIGEGDFKLNIGSQPEFFSTIDRKYTSEIYLYYNCFDNSLDYSTSSFQNSSSYAAVSIGQLLYGQHNPTFRDYVPLRVYSDFAPTRNCFAQQTLPFTPTDLYSVCTYGTQDYQASISNVNIDIYRYIPTGALTASEATGYVVNTITGEKGNITAASAFTGSLMYIFYRTNDTRTLKVYSYNPSTNALTFKTSAGCPSSALGYSNINVKWWPLINQFVIFIAEASSPRSTNLQKCNCYAFFYDPSTNSITYSSASSGLEIISDGVQSNYLYIHPNDGSTWANAMMVLISYYTRPNIDKFVLNYSGGNINITYFGNILAAQAGWIQSFELSGSPIITSYSQNINALQMWDMASFGIPESLGAPIQFKSQVFWALINTNLYGLKPELDFNQFRYVNQADWFSPGLSLKSYHTRGNYTQNFVIQTPDLASPGQCKWLEPYVDADNTQWLISACEGQISCTNLRFVNNPAVFNHYGVGVLPASGADFLRVIPATYNGTTTNLIVMYNFNTATIYTYKIDDLYNTFSSVDLLNQINLTFYDYTGPIGGPFTPTTPRSSYIYTLDVAYDNANGTLRMMVMAPNSEYFLYEWNATYGAWALNEQSINIDPNTNPIVHGLGYLLYYPQYQQLNWVFTFTQNGINEGILTFYSIGVNAAYNLSYNTILIPHSLQSTSLALTTTSKTLSYYDATFGQTINIDVTDYNVVSWQIPYFNCGDTSPTTSSMASYVVSNKALINLTSSTILSTGTINYCYFTQTNNLEYTLTTNQQIPLLGPVTDSNYLQYPTFASILCMRCYTINNSVYVGVLYLDGSISKLYLLDVTSPNSLGSHTLQRSYEGNWTDGVGWVVQVQSNGDPGWCNYLSGDLSNYPQIGNSFEVRGLDISSKYDYVYVCGVYVSNLILTLRDKDNEFIQQTSLFNQAFGNNTTNASFVLKCKTNDGAFDWGLPLLASTQVEADNLKYMTATKEIIVAGNNLSDFSVHAIYSTGPAYPSTSVQTTFGSNSNSSTFLLSLDELGNLQKTSRIYTASPGRNVDPFILATNSNQIVLVGQSNALTIDCIDSTNVNVQTSYSYANSNTWMYFFSSSLGYLGSNIIDYPLDINYNIPRTLNVSESLNKVTVGFSYLTNSTGAVTIYNKDGSVGEKVGLRQYEYDCIVADFKYKYTFTDQTNSTYSQIVYHTPPAYSFTGGAFNNYNVFIFGQQNDTILNHNFGVKSNAIVPLYVNPNLIPPSTVSKYVLYLNNVIDVSKIVKKPLRIQGVNNSNDYFSFQLTNAKLANFIKFSGVNVPGKTALVSYSSFPLPSSTNPQLYITFASGASVNIVPINTISVNVFGQTIVTVEDASQLVVNNYYTVNSFNNSVFYSLQFFPGSLIAPQYYDIEVSGLTIPDRPLLNQSYLGGTRSFNDYPYLYLSVYSTDDEGNYDPEFVNVIYDNTPLSKVKPFPQFLIPVNGFASSESNFSSFSSVLKGVVKFSKNYLNLRFRLLDINGDPIQFDQTPYKAADLKYIDGVPDYLFNMYIRLVLTPKST